MRKTLLCSYRRTAAFPCPRLDTALVLVLLAAFFAAALGGYAALADEVQRETLRLHIRANSDAPADQRVKLLVRDAVLAEQGAALSALAGRGEAEAYLAETLSQIEATARRVLAENGREPVAAASLATRRYPTRWYDENTVLPAGRYRGLELTLGAGAGANWWCVLYPALCLPAAGEKAREAAGENEAAALSAIRVLGEEPQLVPKLKLSEWWAALCEDRSYPQADDRPQTSGGRNFR